MGLTEKKIFNSLKEKNFLLNPINKPNSQSTKQSLKKFNKILLEKESNLMRLKKKLKIKMRIMIYPIFNFKILIEYKIFYSNNKNRNDSK